MTREERLNLIRKAATEPRKAVPLVPAKRADAPRPARVRTERSAPSDAKAKNSARMNEHYARRRASGLCHVCGAPSPDTAACAACRAAKAVYRRKLRQDRADRGVCTHCTSKAKAGQRMCQRCQDDRRERVTQQRKAGR